MTLNVCSLKKILREYVGTEDDNWATLSVYAQEESLLQQLQWGVRSLDIRIGHCKNIVKRKLKLRVFIIELHRRRDSFSLCFRRLVLLQFFWNNFWIFCNFFIIILTYVILLAILSPGSHFVWFPTNQIFFCRWGEGWGILYKDFIMFSSECR